MDYNALRFWLDVLQWAFMLGLLAWTYHAQGRKDNSTEISAIKESFSQLSQRVQTLETIQEHMPTHDDLKALADDLSDVKENVGGVRSDIRALTRQLDLIQNHLLNNKG